MKEETAFLISNIPVNLTPEKVLMALRLNEEFSEVIRGLIDLTHSLIEPRALYKISYIDEKGNNKVKIQEVEFTSLVLRKNLDKVGRVFPYVVTIGKKLEKKISSLNDLMEQYFLDRIATMALSSTVRYLKEYLKEKYKTGPLSGMSPGSLQDWPITEQRKLFSLLGDVEGMLEVRLTKNLLMIPRKSVSGIFFPSQVLFQSCQLCPRKVCPERKAPYNEKLVQQYFGSENLKKNY